MKRFISIFSLFLIAVMLLSMLASCGSKEKQFVGTWTELDSDGKPTGTTMVLANGGTGSVSEDGISGSVTWSVNKDKFFLTISICGMSETEECTYKISKKEMTLINSDGEKTVYRKNSK